MLSVKELKSLNLKELLKELKHARSEMQKIRLTLKTGHEKNTSFSKKWKRQIARILTFLNHLKLQNSAPEKETASSNVTVKEDITKEEAKQKKKVDKK